MNQAPTPAIAASLISATSLPPEAAIACPRVELSGTHSKFISLAAWSTALIGLYLADQSVRGDSGLLVYYTFIVFGGVLYFMQHRYLRARKELAALDASFDVRLREREQELRRQHDQVLASERQRILLEERQRLMRDMHDGIGTALMSSLALAENGELSQERAAKVLRETVDELKLVIDSIEPIDHDLVALLASLRYRFSQRIHDAGILMTWNMKELPPLPWLDPSHALQVLRIVQEALSNVLKHARATTIHISAHPTRSTAKPGVVVRITDNGRGFDPTSVQGGRGLGNLRHRAAALGAELRLQSKPGRGTSISLHLSVDR